MNNPFDYFKKIFLINLDERKDRLEDSIKELNKVGIADRVERLPGIKVEDGRVGVIRSHLEAVKHAKKNKLDNILVFEDDIKFINNPLENLSKAISQIDRPWQLFYLGANTHDKLVVITPNLILLNNGYAVHAMAYHNSIYDEFINYASTVGETIKVFAEILDVWLVCNIQFKQTVLMINPIIAVQRESYSDIEKRIVSYTFIEERFNQNIKKE